MPELNLTNFQRIVLVLVLSLGYSVASAQDARLIAKNTFPSVVMLEMRDDKNRPIKFGSGFFVRPDVVVTNYHVIEGASDGYAKIVGKPTTYQIVGVVGIDKTKDLALLKLKGVVGRPLALADISKIEVGQEVFAFGNPKGLEGTISTGIISGSSLRQLQNENLIQITAPISPGSSGGPVVNRKGEVIGVAVASLKDGQNLNFAVPSSYLAILLARSTNVSPLPSLLGTKGEKSGTSDSEPSLSETTAWITDQLAARKGMIDGLVHKNERLVFENCSMNLVYSVNRVDSRWQSFYTYVAHLSKLTISYPRVQDEMVFLAFPADSIQFRVDDYIDGSLGDTSYRRTDAIEMYVGDKEMSQRLSKAFNRLGKLCKEETKKEPFD